MARTVSNPNDRGYLPSSDAISSFSGFKAQGKSEPVALLRHVLFGRTWCLLPVTVLKRGPECVVVRISCGSTWLAASEESSWLRIGDRPSWTLRPKNWTSFDLTYLIPFGAWCAYGILRNPNSPAPHSLYINFQRPLTETQWGFETLDLELDLIATFEPDGRIKPWVFKDLERFEYLLEMGVFDKLDGNEVRRQAENAVASLNRYLPNLRRMCKVAVSPPSLTTLLSNIRLPGSILNSVDRT